MRLVQIAAGDHHYEAMVGPLQQARDRLRELSGGIPLTAVTDETVWQLHGDHLAAIHPIEPILVPAGEAAKNWPTLETVLAELARRDIKRSTPLIAFGGGSVGDLTGLGAGLFKRGCPIIHVPTTFLAQVDGAIGGKAAIDFAGQKNLVGMFHHPLFVIADPSLLDTLDGRQMRSGYAELVKYGLIGDPPVFTWCEENGQGVLDGDQDARRRAVEFAIRCKARYVSEDPGDRLGVRARLNFGHTFGHAIEAVTGFGPVLHGEAVSVGMALALQLSAELDHCSQTDAERAIAHLRAVGLPTGLADVGLARRGDELVPFMIHDKKADAGGLKLILVRAIGEAFVAGDITPQQLGDFLTRVG